MCNVRNGAGACDPDHDRSDDTFDEYDRAETIMAIACALRGLAADVEPVTADRRLTWRLDEGRYDFAFNIAEGQGRRCREAIAAAVCELMGLPFTGCDAVALGVTLDKWLVCRVVSPEVPVAGAVLVGCEADADRISALRFPVRVKPNDEGSSKGILDDSIAANLQAARDRCRWFRPGESEAGLV